MTLLAILVDAGTLVALVNKGDKETHRKCTSVFRSLRKPLLTTWPCFTEAMSLLGELRGWKGQKTLLEFVSRGAVHIHSPSDNGVGRVQELMKQYQGIPMDFTDASLVLLAEVTGIRKIFTLDSAFQAYRIKGKEVFEVIPIDSE